MRKRARGREQSPGRKGVARQSGVEAAAVPSRAARSSASRGDAGWRRARAEGMVAVLLLGLAAVLPLLPRGCNPYDEGLLAYGAEQVLRGRAPAVDFYSPYGPGAFYLVAAAYRLFGTRLLVERWVAGLLIAAVGALGYALLAERTAPEDAPEAGGGHPDSEAARHQRIAISALAGVLSVLALVAGWWYPPVNSGALALMLLSGLLLQRGGAAGSPRGAALAGAVTGVALIWRLTFGGALLIANALTWLLTTSGRPAGDRGAMRLTGLLALVAWAAVVAFPVYGFLIAAGGHRALHSLLIWPLTSTRAADLPWPAFCHHLRSAGAPLLARLAGLTRGAGFYYWLAALALLVWRLALGAVPPVERRLGLWLFLMFPPFFIYANGRTDYIHLTPLLVFALLLAALALDSGLAVRPANRAGRWTQALGLGVGSAATLLLAPTLLAGWQHGWGYPGRIPVELPGPRGAGVTTNLYRGTRYQQLMWLIDHWVPPTQTIYSGTFRHDIFLTNDLLIYFLAGRDAPTYYTCLDAGVTTTAPVQQQMVRELEEGNVGAAVIWTAPRKGEANAGGESSGVHLLDDWLERAFRGRRFHGPLYELRLRRPS